MTAGACLARSPSPTVDSTNRWAADVAPGAAGGLVVVADAQQAGRGRLGRSWVAPPSSSLLCSILLRPRLPPAELPLVTLALALAAREAIGRLASLEIALKWPNDLLFGEAKLAGILAELVEGPPGEAAIVVGIGVNLSWPEGFGSGSGERELLSSATTLAAAGAVVTRRELLDALLEALSPRYRSLENAAGREALLTEYRRACVTIGRRVRVVQSHREWEGLAEGVDDHGRLVVLGDEGRVTLDAADVVHLRSPETH